MKNLIKIIKDIPKILLFIVALPFIIPTMLLFATIKNFIAYKERAAHKNNNQAAEQKWKQIDSKVNNFFGY